METLNGKILIAEATNEGVAVATFSPFLIKKTIDSEGISKNL